MYMFLPHSQFDLYYQNHELDDLSQKQDLQELRNYEYYLMFYVILHEHAHFHQQQTLSKPYKYIIMKYHLFN